MSSNSRDDQAESEIRAYIEQGNIQAARAIAMETYLYRIEKLCVKTLYGRVRDPESEAAQCALKVFVAFEQIAQKWEFQATIYTALCERALWRCIDAIRKSGKRIYTLEGEDTVDPAPAPEDCMLKKADSPGFSGKISTH